MEVYIEGKNNCITPIPIDPESHEVIIDDSIALLTPEEGCCHVIYTFGNSVMRLKMDAKHPAYSFTCNDGIVTFRY
jgi:hypothetical protein